MARTATETTETMRRQRPGEESSVGCGEATALTVEERKKEFENDSWLDALRREGPEWPLQGGRLLRARAWLNETGRNG